MSATFATHDVSTHQARPAGEAAELALIVEDNDSIGPLLAMMLGPQFRRTQWVRSTAEALDWFPAHMEEVALAVLDCGLPDGHVGPLAHRLRTQRPGLPLLVTSGRAHPDLMRLLAADGPVDFLPKPFAAKDLAEKVRRLLAAVGSP